MATLTVPRNIRIQDMIVGPVEGWHWTLGPDAGPIHVRCDQPPLGFVEPVAIAMFGAWAHHQRELGREVVIDETIRSRMAYESGLLSAIAGRATGGVPKAASRFFRLTSESAIAYELSELVEGTVGSPHAAEKIVHYCVSELAQNVFDHARTRGQGAFCAISFDARTGRVRLAVADCGKGVPATIKPHYEGDLTDDESLELALEPELSGLSARDDVNRGVGLYFVRRLALAANGAFCLVTQELSARASTRTRSDFTPKIARIPSCWRGTAVATTFTAQNADFSGPIEAIKDEIEGRGPKYADIMFYGRTDSSTDAHRVIVEPDRGKFAIERERARGLALDHALPLLKRGARVELDFTGVAKATQAFCHALIVPLIRHGGADALARLRFVGCSPRTRSTICFAVNYVQDQAED